MSCAPFLRKNRDMLRLFPPADTAALLGLAAWLAASARRPSGAAALRRAGGAFADPPVEAAEQILCHLAPRPGSNEIRAFRRQGALVQPLAIATLPDGAADPAAARRLLTLGATLALHKIDALDFAWHRLARAFEGLTAQPVQVNLYLTGQATPGLNWHRDPHDVLVMQLAGGKRFALAEDLADNGAPVRPDVAELYPGDLLWLPRGCPHAVVSGAGGSIHASFGLLHLAQGLGGLERVTRPLGPTASPGSPALIPTSHLAATLEFLTRWRPMRSLPPGLEGGTQLRPDLLAWSLGGRANLGGRNLEMSRTELDTLAKGCLPEMARDLLASRLSPAADLHDLLAGAGLLPVPSLELSDA